MNQGVRQLEFRFAGNGEELWDRLVEESRRQVAEVLCQLLSEVVQKEAEERKVRSEREGHESAS
jgi:hypothetical protein